MRPPFPTTPLPTPYFFHLFALDTALSLPPASTAKQLKAAMQGRILAEAQLMGTYRRKGR